MPVQPGLNAEGRIDERDGHSEIVFGVNTPSDPHKEEQLITPIGRTAIGMPLASAEVGDSLTAENGRPQRNNNKTEDDRFEARKLVGAGSGQGESGNLVRVGLVDLANEPQNARHGKHLAAGNDIGFAPRNGV